MRNKFRAALSIATMAVCANFADAHHSNVSYRMDEPMILQGTVTRWQWINPHTWLSISVQDENGKSVEWLVEGRSPGVLARAGWNRDILQPGEVVTVLVRPSKDVSNVGNFARITKSDGTILGNRPEAAATVDADIARAAAENRIVGKPNFSGVYFPFTPEGAARRPLSNGTQGRLPHQPKLTPDYICLLYTSPSPRD